MNNLIIRYFSGLFLIMFLLAGGGVADTAKLTIIANPGPFPTIQEAAAGEKRVNWWDADLSDDTACTECFAAMELRRFLAKCVGLPEKDIQLASPNRLPDQGNVFLLGNRYSNPLMRSFKENSLAHEQERKAESFGIDTVAQKGRTLYLIEGADRTGTLYGVYAFLEQLGMRFFGLGEQGTVYPDSPVTLPREIHRIDGPKFLTRGFWAWEDRGNTEFFLWMARNRMNFWTSAEKEIYFLKKLGMKLTDGGHIIQKYFLDPHAEYPYNHPKFKGDDNKPADPYSVGKNYLGDANEDGKLTYFEAHPEWYALRNGKRSDNIKDESGDNFCTSNVDARKELAKNLIQSLIDGRWSHVDVVNFWMLDGGKWCECEQCKKQGTYTDRLLDVINTLLVEMKKARAENRLQRNVDVVTLAYWETLSPPTHPLPKNFDYEHCSVTFFPIQRCYVHALADPACTEINKHILEDYQGWTMGSGRFYKGSIFIGEYYNVSSIKSMPVVYPHIMAADIPWYYRTGARHFHYMHTPTRLWGTWTLNQYLLARLLWNPDTDVTALLDNYFNRYYPTTSKHTRKFYQHLEKASANIKAFKHYVSTGTLGYSLRGRWTNVSSELFPLEHFKYEEYHPATNDGPDMVEIVDAMRLARKELDASLLQCANATERARLLEDERRFAYGEDMVYFYYHMTRTATFYRRQETELARREFQSVERYAKRLRSITELVHVSSRDANSPNGLEATQAVKQYELFKEKYGK